MHVLQFTKTKKDTLEQHVNAVRVAFARGQIVIHPRCKKLIKQLRNGVFQNSRTRLRFDWKRDELGHFDCVAALLYLWRAVNENRHKNPYPVEAYYVSDKDHNPSLGERPPGFSADLRAVTSSRHRSALTWRDRPTRARQVRAARASSRIPRKRLGEVREPEPSGRPELAVRSRASCTRSKDANGAKLGAEDVPICPVTVAVIAYQRTPRR
jgi:hypothetical protein